MTERCSVIVVVASVAFLLGASRSARAKDLWISEDGETRLALDTSLKATSLLSYSPKERALFPHRRRAVGLLRLRLDFSAQLGPRVNTEVSYEQWARWVSAGDVRAGGGILPGGGDSPFRIEQLSREFGTRKTTYVQGHELDRAYVALHPDWGEITLGRQAIGLGRGRIFSAVDVFSPFSTTEVDREWRRGVDAARVEYRLGDTTSLEGIIVGGETWHDSALLGRLRGYVGDVDGELIVGKRARDMMYGGTLSAVVGDAEVHVEAALFKTHERFDRGLFGKDRLVGKTVVGTSYTFDVGDGLHVAGEYHYSGFGVRDPDDIVTTLTRPKYRERVLRGDTQIMGRHALGVQASYPFTNTLSGSLLVLQSPRDGSGLASPGISWDATSYLSIRASAFAPWGARPRHGRLRSQYGGSGFSLFLQAALYF